MQVFTVPTVVDGLDAGDWFAFGPDGYGYPCEKAEADGFVLGRAFTEVAAVEVLLRVSGKRRADELDAVLGRALDVGDAL